MTVRRGERTIATVGGYADAAGRVALTWKPRDSRPGRYRLSLRAIGDGDSASAAVDLRLARPRRSDTPRTPNETCEFTVGGCSALQPPSGTNSRGAGRRP